MKINEYLQKFEHLHDLIQREQTGSLKELSNKLHLSPRRTRDYISFLKDMGAPIVFCRLRRSYIYKHKIELHIEFFLEIEKNDEVAI